MGYYVKIEESSAVIPANNKSKVLEIWKALNAPENNHLKGGGSYSGGEKTSHWFSWMPADYDKTVSTVEEVLELLGFECTTLDNGDVSIDGYDSKAGQEDLFLERVEFLLTGKISWFGEEGETWETIFKGDSVIEGEVTRTALPLIEEN